MLKILGWGPPLGSKLSLKFDAKSVIYRKITEELFQFFSKPFQRFEFLLVCYL